MAAIDILDSINQKYDNTTSGLTASNAKGAIDEIAARPTDLIGDTTPQLGGTLDANGNTIDMGVNLITDVKVGQWDTAVTWGDHALVGYLTVETSHADVLVDGDFGTAGLMTSNGAGGYSITTNNSANWNTAFGWGDHSLGGYLTSFTETNDLSAAVTWVNVPDANITQTSVTQHQAALSITESQISNLQAYLTSETSHADVLVDGEFISEGFMRRGATTGTYTIVIDNSANWNTAFGWGDHSLVGYLTTVAFADLTATPTTIAGYGITDEFTGFNKTTSAGSKTLVVNESCVFTATGTATLPASPTAMDEVIIVSGNFSNLIIARNGTNILGLAENLVVDRPYYKVHLRYIDPTSGWVLT